VLCAAATIALRHPALVFRNPEKLARAWELQRRGRDLFIEHFGGDVLVVPGRELASHLQGYWDFCDRATAAGDLPRPTTDLPADLHNAATVGVIYDEVDGLQMYPNFGARRLHATVVNACVRSDA
jgi:hypothetical protein